MSDVLRLGTRASLPARTQSALVADLIRARTGREVELVDVTTEGDVNRSSLVSLGGTGVFVGALRDALLRGDVDVAVHHLGAAARADELAARLHEHLPRLRRLHVSEVGAVVGAHVGPGALAVVVVPR